MYPLTSPWTAPCQSPAQLERRPGHAGTRTQTWGVVGIYSGIEIETRYEKPTAPNVPLTTRGAEAWTRGQVTVCCTTDDDVHEVRCGGDEPVVGIHVYGADIGTLPRRSYDRKQAPWTGSPPRGRIRLATQARRPRSNPTALGTKQFQRSSHSAQRLEVMGSVPLERPTRPYSHSRYARIAAKRPCPRKAAGNDPAASIASALLPRSTESGFD